MKYDLDAIRARVSLLDLYAEAGFSPRRAGSAWVGLCPFHEERSGSFSLGIHGGVWRAKCFGCGWRGDALDFFAAARGIALRDAMAALAGRCGLGPVAADGGGWKRPARPAAAREEAWRKPWLPPDLARGSDEDMARLVELRGLSVAGLEAASRAGHLFFCEWPWVWDAERKVRRLRPDAVRSWCITDGSRWTAQYRRLDGGMYRIGAGEDARTSKSWSTRNVAWPVGAESIRDRGCVLLMEGGADLLACFHFLALWGLLDAVAVCCVLGASNRLAPMAMEHFRDREVRILMDADVVRDGRAPGMEAAARWQGQLAAAGASVTVGSLYGLRRRDGAEVKDVNDLVYCDEGTLMEARPLFSEWGL